MLPASTRSPPKRLTPRNFGFESRPLRVEPPAFLCAICLALDAGDLDFGVVLAMAHLLHVVLAALELDDAHLVPATVAHDFGRDLAAIDGRRADPNVVAVGNHQNFIELDRGAVFGVQLFDSEDFPGRGLVLLAAGLEYRVHDYGLQNNALRLKSGNVTDFRLRGQYPNSNTAMCGDAPGSSCRFCLQK